MSVQIMHLFDRLSVHVTVEMGTGALAIMCQHQLIGK
jgi:hypothetical protein